MNAQLKRWREDRSLAHYAPLIWFLLSIFCLDLIAGTFSWGHPDAPWWRRWPETWILGFQTLTTSALIVFFWKHYEFRFSSKHLLIGVIMGAVGIGFWLLPTMIYDRMGLTENPEGWMKWLGINDRKEGFNPSDLENPFWEKVWIVMRFVRAVVIVAIVEEVLWRGFLMRYLLKPDGDFWSVPFGTPSWMTYGVVTFAFIIAHAPIDYAGAFVYGTLMYVVAIWTKSLFACVIMHGVSNFIMCWFALAYQKFGLL